MMDNFGNMVKYDGKYVPYDYFKEKVAEQYQAHGPIQIEQAAVFINSAPRDVHKATLDVIIDYCKENTSVGCKDVCRALRVKSDYIVELVDDGRLEFSKEELSEMSIEFKEEEASAVQTARNQVNLINMQKMSGLPVTVKEEPVCKGYHYSRR